MPGTPCGCGGPGGSMPMLPAGGDKPVTVPPLPLTRRLALAGATLLAGQGAAQTPPAAPFTITYIEADPAGQDAVLGHLRAHAATARRQPGCVALRALRRIDRTHHFALVEQWQDGAAADAHRASPAMAVLKARLAPLLIAPYDERPHLALAAGAFAPGPGAILAVTHVDVVPTGREAGANALAALVPAGRAAPGNQGFDALVQASRANHFTLVEAWRDEAALLAHAASPAMRACRATLGPLNGSLYDERLYREA